jgi:hypothetical protein
VRITKEKIFCSSHACHNVKGNSTESASFFILAFEEKRAERPHLQANSSPILGFPSHSLCLIVNGV